VTVFSNDFPAIWNAVFAAEYVRLRDGAAHSSGETVLAMKVADEAVDGLRHLGLLERVRARRTKQQP
jgi:hypothetical protein